MRLLPGSLVQITAWAHICLKRQELIIRFSVMAIAIALTCFHYLSLDVLFD